MVYTGKVVSVILFGNDSFVAIHLFCNYNNSLSIECYRLTSVNMQVLIQNQGFLFALILLTINNI